MRKEKRKTRVKNKANTKIHVTNFRRLGANGKLRWI